MRRTAERLLLATAIAASGAARAAPDGCDLDVRFDRASLMLGHPSAAHLTVRAPARPELSVTTGSLGPLRELSPGVYQAEYRPPARSYPQLALVAAVAGDRCGFAVLPLAGRAEALARGAPGAKVAVRVGQRLFGPVRADARGRAVVPVEVPPGTTAVWHGDRPLELPPAPPVPHLQLAVPSAARRADRDELVPVRVLAVRADGAPRTDASLAFATSHGTVGAAAEVAPGVYAASWRLPPGAAGEATLEVALAGEPPPAAARLERRAGPVATIEVSATPAIAVAGAGPVELTFAARDAAGNAVDAAPDVRTAFGALRGAERLGPGRFRAMLDLPEAHGGRTAALVDALAGDARGRAEVPLAAAGAAAVRLEAPPSPIVADGRGAAPLRVAVLDRFGNAVEGAPPRVEAEAGVVSDGTRQGDGSWTFRWRPARRLEPGDATVRASAAGARAEARVGLAPPRPWIWLAPRAGWAFSRAGTGAAAGLSAEAWARIAGEALGASLDVGRLTLSRTSDAELNGASAPLASTLEATTVVLGLSWFRPIARVAAVWGTAGAGLSHLAATATLAGQPAVSGAGLAPRAELAIAGGARVPGGLAFVEARAGLDGPRRLAAFDGALSTFTLCAGYRWDAR